MTDDNIVRRTGKERWLTPAEAAFEEVKVLKEQVKALTERIERLEGRGMTDNELSKDQIGVLFDVCKPAWETIPDDMVGKVWAGGPRLLPCPSCGDCAEMRFEYGHYHARCTNPECLVRTRDYRKVTEAIMEWNRRAKEGLSDESLDEYCKRKDYPLAPKDCILCPRALQVDGDPSIIRCSDSRYNGKKCPI